ncbi:hypothetical protein A2V61_03960 [Candidatus Woesebacteria bacterium RBG_19FT_COMBO_47_8]|uniref:DUF4012 domain-containing protein n=1 Tax=Candidatus Woesebacteria bacterium RBG_13_46_13 TaxID=1802479 RepID=A0A1F7X505_9BACT|nr:MAG: hypothetical protein A2Y68_01945 [Candidatus Woesebacteria bacterium RBG_13_46_13]OGM16818.1 MAG: hypothetical protein A2V61_03960 [Candidatus Woesebacteria bacterium RBG_19FT_COMBO_47_8]HJX59346.1 DUF4012 domain-containing protein [Patescibacteria group bacterium]
MNPTVAVFSEYHPLVLNVVETLLGKSCRVLVLSSQTEHWRINTRHLGESARIEIQDENITSTLAEFDYAVCSLLTDERENSSEDRIARTIQNAQAWLSKTIFIIPLAGLPEKTLKSLEAAIKVVDFSSTVVFLKDTYGPRMSSSEKYGLGAVLSGYLRGGEVGINGEDLFYPTFYPDIAKEITKAMFSFGPPYESFAILGEPLKGEQIVEILGKEKEVRISFGRAPQQRELLPGNVVRTSTRFSEGIKPTLEWFRQQPARKEAIVKAVKTKKSMPPKAPGVAVRRYLLLAALFLVLAPFLLMATSVLSLVVGKNGLEKGNTASSQRAFATTKFTARMLKAPLAIAASVPVLGKAFYQPLQASSLLERASDIGIKTGSVVDGLSGLVQKALGKEVYDPLLYSKEMTLTLENLYQEVGFLEGDIGSQKTLIGGLAHKLINNLDLGDIKSKILLLRGVTKELPSILGRDKPSTYLILFQNNMELRPTGGFVGSLALVTFDGGRLSDINVLDVYSADGQLKGHVEPPTPIKDYLGEANWFLRDSNWDPDFPTSASRAEWFLGKEIGKAVDGVIAVDLEVARSLLKATGPIKLADYGQQVSSENLYEKTQQEVEEAFFPGSHKKASFLTALAQQLLDAIVNYPKNQSSTLANLIQQNLIERHIQVFLHQKEAQKAISGFGFDGSFLVPSCDGNCYSDFLGLVEANVGVNKANYFIKRSFALEVGAEEGVLRRSLLVQYDNSANPALGSPGRYKAYLRLALPLDVEITTTEVLSPDAAATPPEIKDVGGRREAGVLLEIAPGQSKSVKFSWQSPTLLNYSKQGEYRLFWRKQAGTDNDPLKLTFIPPSGVDILFSPKFSLTQAGSFVYNTTLARDLFSRVSW